MTENCLSVVKYGLELTLKPNENIQINVLNIYDMVKQFIFFKHN